jgi:MinD superfamily P-loop ATPase
MKEVVVISGKGGTGKTSITGCFGALAEGPVLADCDVDAADLHLIVKPDVKQSFDFTGGKRAAVISQKCIGCGKCKEYCSFDAVNFNGEGNNIVAKTYTIDPVSCEGCGVCKWFCPADAISFADCINGKWFISETRFGPMVHARLGIAEENSGKLVTLIRKEVKKKAQELGKDMIIVDGSPGIGCPVIASITGSDIVLVVAEPTLSGKSDLERVAKLTKNFNIKTFVCINKYDINPQMADQVTKMSEKMGLCVVGRVSYDNVFTDAQIEGKSVVEFDHGNVSRQIKEMWQKISSFIRK